MLDCPWVEGRAGCFCPSLINCLYFVAQNPPVTMYFVNVKLCHESPLNMLSLHRVEKESDSILVGMGVQTILTHKELVKYGIWNAQDNFL